MLNAVLRGPNVLILSFRFGNYIWPAMLVWGFERTVRSLKLIWNNRIWSLSDQQSKIASIEHLTNDTGGLLNNIMYRWEAHICFKKVRLTLRRKMNWTHVILPSISNIPSEAHPFTISSISHSLDGTDKHEDKDLVFLIRGRSGFTQRLLEHAGRKGSISTVPAFVDGPYGSPPDLSVFSTCILFAGVLISRMLSSAN